MTDPAAGATDGLSHGFMATDGVIGECPACSGGIVLVNGCIAAHILTSATCGAAHIHPPNAPNYLVMGSSTVHIHGKPAARWDPSGDLALCTAKLGVGPGSRTVVIGGPAVTDLPAPTSDAETLAQAMFRVKTSDFAQTEEGRKVVNKLEELYAGGNIKFESLASRRGQWHQGDISVDSNRGRNRDAEYAASELVHEGTHAVDEDEDWRDPNRSIDEEMRTNGNQLDFYEEQRQRGYTVRELNRRRTRRNKGEMRDEIRERYPNAPEHKP